MTYIRAWMSSKFGQIRSGTTELAALEHLKNRCCPFSRFTVVDIPEKKSGERLQDHWSSGHDMLLNIYRRTYLKEIHSHLNIKLL